MSDLLNSASLVMIPSGYKEDVVYSQIPTDGSGDLAFTRASNGTRINSAGLVEVCPWNLASDSNSFGGLSAITKTTGQPSPIDSTSGNLLTATGSGEHYSGTASLTVIAGNTYTYSVYGKFVQGVNLALRTVFANGDADISTIWNLNTGALVLNAGDHQNPTITNVGNGWYRCSITYTPASVPAFPLLFRLQMAVGANLSFTATSGDGFLAYGAQINNGAIAPYFPTTDRLNVPRLTYQNGGGGCPSLLLEKQSTNLALYSEQIDNAYWTKNRSTITANNTTSPDGTQNADKIVETATTLYHGIERAFGTLSGSHSLSIFAKAAERNWVYLEFFTGATSFTSFFDLSNGTIGTSAVGNNAKIENYGNGWYRLSISRAAGSGTSFFVAGLASADNTASYTGNGTSGAYFYGAQLEASSYATSYIPTTSSSATRVADACYKNSYAGGISTEATIFADFEYQRNDGGYSTPCLIYNASLGNYLYIFVLGNTIRVICVNSGGVQSQIITSTVTPNTRYKVAAGFKTNDFVVYVNGSLIGTDTSGTMPTFSNTGTNIYIGTDASLTEPVGKLNECVLFPTRLTNAELASLTTI